jgi:DNA-binding GntR family transcriptional regulator
VEAISDLPMHNDIDADYSPQYIKLARIVRGKIESGAYKRGDPVLSAGLAREHGVSMLVARTALAMLAANRYVGRSGSSGAYRVIWDTATCPVNKASAP